MDLQNSIEGTQANLVLQHELPIKSVAQNGFFGFYVFFCKFGPIGTTVRSYILVWQFADGDSFRSVIDFTIGDYHGNCTEYHT